MNLSFAARNQWCRVIGALGVFGLGPWELAIILIIVVILFGVGKLPELGTGLGEGIKNFKKSYRDAKALDVTPEGTSQDTSKTEKESATTKSGSTKE
jgi:sec-independent protein translocase protein TatA